MLPYIKSLLFDPGKEKPETCQKEKVDAFFSEFSKDIYNFFLWGLRLNALVTKKDAFYFKSKMSPRFFLLLVIGPLLIYISLKEMSDLIRHLPLRYIISINTFKT